MKRIYILLLLIPFLHACTTQKSRSDQSWLAKTYHNTTAKYNGYFNADEIMTATTASLSTQHRDNYNQLLPVYPYLAVDNPQAEAGNLDEAIEKVSIVASVHPYSHWVDDCYLLIGQAQYMKQDFESAEETLVYMNEEFTPQGKAKKVRKPVSKAQKQKEAKAKKEKREKEQKEKRKASDDAKKEREKSRKEYNKQVKRYRKLKAKGKVVPVPKKPGEEQATDSTAIKAAQTQEAEKDPKKAAEQPETNPDKYFMKHRPVYQDGQLWLARTYIEREKYDLAQRLLTLLANDSRTFPEVREEVPVAMAHMFIKRKQYAQAALPLEEAIKLATDKAKRARYSFILAQLYQRAGNETAAYAAFEKALDQKPSYEMDFNCRLSMALSAWRSGQSTADATIKQLERMTKDAKNAEFKDQLFYSIATIALKDGDRPAAIENLQLALQNGGENNAQRAEAYLLLGNLYFEAENFVQAKHYYDSTLQVLPQNDERHTSVSSLSNNLTEIAANMEMITLQDSLLNISRMSDDDKKKLALKMQEEQAKRQAEQAAATAAAQAPGKKSFGANVPAVGIAGGASAPAHTLSTFFAYAEDRNLRRDLRDFERTWGDRILEDNWRRSNKRTTGGTVAAAGGDSPERQAEITTEDLASFLKGVPSSPEAIQSANDQIMNALFSLGRLFRERLENNRKSVQSLEELLRRYPDTKYQLEAWYFLHLAYKEMNNTAKAQEYYRLITEKYPDSAFARALRDPNFVNAGKEEEQKLNRYYDETFELYSKGDYQQAFSRIGQADNMFGKQHPLQARFALLSALCVGNLQGRDAYLDALKEVIAQYPNSPEERRAKEMLRLLNGEDAQSSRVVPGRSNDAGTPAAGSAGPFKAEDDKLHYIIVVLPDESKLTEAKVLISDFNRKFFNLDNLRITHLNMGTTPVVVIRRYADRNAAMRYYETIAKNKQDFLDGANIQYEAYPVTQNNYREVINANSTAAYRVFFEGHYLKK